MLNNKIDNKPNGPVIVLISYRQVNVLSTFCFEFISIPVDYEVDQSVDFSVIFDGISSNSMKFYFDFFLYKIMKHRFFSNFSFNLMNFDILSFDRYTKSNSKFDEIPSKLRYRSNFSPYNIYQKYHLT